MPTAIGAAFGLLQHSIIHLSLCSSDLNEVISCRNLKEWLKVDMANKMNSYTFDVYSSNYNTELGTIRIQSIHWPLLVRAINSFFLYIAKKNNLFIFCLNITFIAITSDKLHLNTTSCIRYM